MSDHDEFGAFLAGFIIGGLAGAAAALMLAPQSGEETRALIRERSIELRDQASAEAEAAWKRAEEAAKEASARADELAEKARAQSAELTEKARAKGKELAETARKAVSRKGASVALDTPAESE